MIPKPGLIATDTRFCVIASKYCKAWMHNCSSPTPRSDWLAPNGRSGVWLVSMSLRSGLQ